MGRFVNTSTGVTFSVDDSKDDRYAGAGYESADQPAKRAPATKAASKSEK